MTEAASKYEGILARFYDADHAWRDYKKQSRFLASLLRREGFSPDAKVLDLCCGTGTHALALAARGLNVTGVDASRMFLRLAREKNRLAAGKARFLRADVFKMDRDARFKGRFDAAFLLGWTLSMDPIFSRLGKLLQVVRRALKPGGLFVLDVPMGGHLRSVSGRPLIYKLSPRLSGTLRIRERSGRKKGARTFEYLWTLRETRNGRIFERKFRARERLRRISPASFLPLLRRARGFERAAVLRDYDSGFPFRNGDKNLVAVLKKCTA